MTLFLRNPSDIIDKETIHKEIVDNANIIISTVEDSIKAANEKGKIYTLTEVNTIFDVQTMEPADAQREIYFYVIKILRKVGYEAFFYPVGEYKIGKLKLYLLVVWDNLKKIQKTNSHKSKFIRRATINKKITHRNKKI